MQLDLFQVQSGAKSRLAAEGAECGVPESVTYDRSGPKGGCPPQVRAVFGKGGSVITVQHWHALDM